jgi:hypothetical protein
VQAAVEQVLYLLAHSILFPAQLQSELVALVQSQVMAQDLTEMLRF